MRLLTTTSSWFAALALTVAMGCGGAPGDQLIIPDSPDGTVRVVMDGLGQHRPEVLWRALPASYQQDVNDLSVAFAENMDPVVFDRLVVVARKGTVVLQAKKELILSTETFRSTGIDPETIDSLWESSIHFIDTLLASDLAVLDAYADLDVDAFLGSTGRELMGHAAGFSASEDDADTLAERLADLETTEVDLLSEDGDEAVIRISPLDGEPTELEMIRIEGRWLPSDLARQWPGMVERAQSRIEFLGTEEAAQTKVQILFGIGVAEGFVDQIEQMESPQELDILIGGFLGNFMPTQTGQMVTEG
jgi:hypothetical protein